MFRKRVPPWPSFTMNWVAPPARAPAMSAFTSGGQLLAEPLMLGFVAAPVARPHLGAVPDDARQSLHVADDVDAEAILLHDLLELLARELVLGDTEDGIGRRGVARGRRRRRRCLRRRGSGQGKEAGEENAPHRMTISSTASSSQPISLALLVVRVKVRSPTLSSFHSLSSATWVTMLSAKLRRSLNWTW